MAAKIIEVEALGVERIGDGSTEHGAILTLVQRPRHKAAGPTPSAARSYHYAAGPRSLGRRSATGHRSATGGLSVMVGPFLRRCLRLRYGYDEHARPSPGGESRPPGPARLRWLARGVRRS